MGRFKKGSFERIEEEDEKENMVQDIRIIQFLEKSQTEKDDIDLSGLDEDLAKDFKTLRIYKRAIYTRIEECVGKTAVVLMGTTGCGKSVLFNYMLRQSLRPLSKEEIAEHEIKVQFGVTPVDLANAAQGNVSSPIGHGTISKTSYPILGFVDDLVICDCSGFYDNQTKIDTFVRLTNSMCIHNILLSAKAVIIVCLLDFSNFVADRGKSINTVGQCLDAFFGGERQSKQIASKCGVLVAVSKIPFVGHPGQMQYTQQDFQSELKKASSPAMQRAAENPIVMFDPLNRNRDHFFAGPMMNRKQLLETLQREEAIRNPSEVFSHFDRAEDIRDEIRKFGLKCESRFIDYLQSSCRDPKQLNACSLHKAVKIYQELSSFEFEEFVQPIRRCSEKYKEFCENQVKEMETLELNTFDKVDEAFNPIIDETKSMKIDEKYATNFVSLEYKYKLKIVLKEAGIITGGAAACLGVGVGVACGIIFPPAIPLEILGGSLIGAAVAGGGISGVSLWRFIKHWQDKKEHAEKAVEKVQQNVVEWNPVSTASLQDDESSDYLVDCSETDPLLP